VRKLKKVIYILLMLLPTLTFAQDTTSKFSIGILFAPNYSYRFISTDDNNSSVMYVIEVRNDTEIPKFGYTFGLTFDYSISEKLQLETGILFSDNGEQTKKLTLTFASQWDPQTGTIVIQPSDSLPRFVSFKYNYYYFDIPLNVRYHVINKTIGIYITSGISTNIHITNRWVRKLYYDDEKVDKEASTTNYNFRKFNVSAQFGIGFNYKISSKFNVSIQPTFRYMIFSIWNAPIKQKFYSIGLATKINLKL